MLPLARFLIRLAMNRLVFNLSLPAKVNARNMHSGTSIVPSILASLLFFSTLSGCAQPQPDTPVRILRTEEPLATGAEQTNVWFPVLKGKKVGICTNHTGRIGKSHLVDTMLASGIKVVKIFGPEHGFRGMGDAGELMGDQKDLKTGLPVISLYGKNKKPTPEQMRDIEIMVFDIQDVGARFYTYISTLHYVMEACARADVPMLVLDRPNPNGHYVDGPVRKSGFQSFVGMHPIPVVHGLTVGELAMMINGEGWLGKDLNCQLTVIPCRGYTHAQRFEISIPPSPNLRDPQAVWLYPSLCFFEPTVVSVGRGTDKAFRVIGYPEGVIGTYEFTPESMPGAKSPMYAGKRCRGLDLSAEADKFSKPGATLDIGWLLRFYRSHAGSKPFFTDEKFFDLLWGTDEVRKLINAGATEADIRKSWAAELQVFKDLRKKYLLYPDFE
jgi:uncharacterized protein YbbC (DUF1343 family)